MGVDRSGRKDGRIITCRLIARVWTLLLGLNLLASPNARLRSQRIDVGGTSRGKAKFCSSLRELELCVPTSAGLC